MFIKLRCVCSVLPTSPAHRQAISTRMVVVLVNSDGHTGIFDLTDDLSIFPPGNPGQDLLRTGRGRLGLHVAFDVTSVTRLQLLFFAQSSSFLRRAD
ncbi:unnamed protein product [Periconia digitata]|uniref:Uncharacterized protein n=1 Tax=Periconia digitata TaxID=1303443 RepID=A0A9W4UG65_9PLEO|nr:unnamed protein product [Periconia digitata]